MWLKLNRCHRKKRSSLLFLSAQTAAFWDPTSINVLPHIVEQPATGNLVVYDDGVSSVERQGDGGCTFVRIIDTSDRNVG